MTAAVEGAARAGLVTGCSSGLGRALAEELRRRGWRVFAGVRRPESAAELAGTGLTPVMLDVTDGATIRAAVRDVVTAAGRLDLVVNNAGYGLIGPAVELELDELRRQLETNLVGVLAVIRAALPALVASGDGRVVNIGSVSGVTATPFAGAYSASKAALHLLSDALRMELAPFGVKVVTVQPGAVASRFGANAAEAAFQAGPGSRYQPVADMVQQRARLSESDPTPAERVARRILDRALRPRPPAVIRVARGSRLLPLLGRLPAPWRDRILSRRFHLHELGGSEE